MVCEVGLPLPVVQVLVTIFLSGVTKVWCSSFMFIPSCSIGTRYVPPVIYRRESSFPGGKGASRPNSGENTMPLASGVPVASSFEQGSL
jgi:hypothetical protein